MKSPDQIKQALSAYLEEPQSYYPKCGKCPYFYDEHCQLQLFSDALEYILQLEIKEMEELQ